jgi:transposase
MDETLFPLPPAIEPEKAPEAGKPRIQQANREQILLIPVDLESSLASDHPARLIWDLLDELDLSPLYARIQAVEGHAGRSAIDPAILVGLWLLATLEGVGSARTLAQLCREHNAYRWMCGGVSVNYHTLADFRVAHGELLEQLLVQGVATLMVTGQVSLERVAQDGKRVRASAGNNSFRRRKSLERCWKEAQEQVEQLSQELHQDPAATSRRQKAARQRAAQERKERLQKALKRVEQLEEKQKKQTQKVGRNRSNQEPRASTTDPEASKMKMADGGYRPAYNVQFATDTESRVIVGVEVSTQGNDGGLMEPMRKQIESHYGRSPQEYLVDGGFLDLEDIETASRHHTQVYAPVKASRRADQDRYAPRADDSPAIAAWRQRMGSEAGQKIYKLRASTAEWVNAVQHNRGLVAVRMRGREKVKAVVLWFALLHNLLRAWELRKQTALAH